MEITYSVHDVGETIVVDDQDDLKSLLSEIETELRSRHPQLGHKPSFILAIATGLLNALADDLDEVELGEMA